MVLASAESSLSTDGPLADPSLQAASANKAHVAIAPPNCLRPISFVSFIVENLHPRSHCKAFSLAWRISTLHCRISRLAAEASNRSADASKACILARTHTELDRSRPNFERPRRTSVATRVARSNGACGRTKFRSQTSAAVSAERRGRNPALCFRDTGSSNLAGMVGPMPAGGPRPCL